MKSCITQQADGLQLSGELTLATVGQLFKNSSPLLKTMADPIHLDLSAIHLSDSAGVALLAAWVRTVRQQGKEIFLKNIPPQMWATIHVSGLTNILPITNHS